MFAISLLIAVAGYAYQLPSTTGFRVVARVPGLRASEAGGELAKEFKEFNTRVAWEGTATTIDPRTAVPSAPIEYKHYVFEHEDEFSVRTTTTTADGARCDETMAYARAGLDVDLDGSYSAEHRDGLKFPSLFGGSDLGATVVLEHSLATSDRERRRLLLSYSADSGALEQVLLLVEGRCVDGEDAPPPANAPQSTLYALLGTWAGDACMRSVARSQPARAAGLGFGARTGGKMSKAQGAASGKGEVVRTAVFKARLSYAWDGETTVARQLLATSFGEDSGEPTATIRGVGQLQTTAGEWADYESVTFPADASKPVLLLLPASCHILAPTQLPPLGGHDGDEASSAFPFSTEFGALLEPGEGFGWQGYQAAAEYEEESEESEGGVLPEGDAEAMRLVRIQRLYDDSGSFVSGTTSLCTAE